MANRATELLKDLKSTFFLIWIKWGKKAVCETNLCDNLCDKVVMSCNTDDVTLWMKVGGTEKNDKRARMKGH